MSGTDILSSEPAKKLLIKRARLLASARNKMPLLRDLLSLKRSEKHILIYCGDGQVEGDVGEGTKRQIEEVARIVGEELRMTCAMYTADTKPKRRQELLFEFERGLIQVLIAIRCLDEGVDVPATKTAILLASSTNPRQFIQRRGRVLRRFPGKEHAIIHDVFVLPPEDSMSSDSPEYRSARTMFRSQLLRAQEFSSIAENGPVARQELVRIADNLHLLDAWEDKT